MGNHNETNFEVNLLPVISLLAVCISFLLLTAVWIPIGTMDIKQAMGETSENIEEPSRFEIQLAAPHLFVVSVEQKGKAIKRFKVSDTSEDHQKVSHTLKSLSEKYPEIRMAFVTPTKRTKYKQMIAMLETLKKLEMKEIGITPMM